MLDILYGALKGALIGGLIGGLAMAAILGFSSLLSMVFPRSQRKSASAGLILLGVVMALTNLPYVWGMLEQDKTRDIIFIALLFGGGFLAISGVYLSVLSREVEKAEPVEDPAFNPIWIIVSASFSLVLVAGLALFLLVVPGQQNKAGLEEEIARRVETIGRQPKIFQTDDSVIDSIDEALQNFSEDEAVWYLLKEENMDPERRVEVCEVLLKNDIAMPAVKLWAGPEIIPLLRQESEKEGNGALRYKVWLEVYSELAGAEAAPLLVSRLGNSLSFDTKPMLEKIGPDAEEFLIPHFNSEARMKRRHVRDLLSQWNTEGELIVFQCLKDLESGDSKLYNSALHYLDKLSGEIDTEAKIKVGEKMEQLVLDDEVSGLRTVIKILAKHPTSNTPTVLAKLLESPDAVAQSEARKAIKIIEQRGK